MSQPQSPILELIAALLNAGDLEQLHQISLETLLGPKRQTLPALLLVRESGTHFRLAASNQLEVAPLLIGEPRLIAQHQTGRAGWNAGQTTPITLLEAVPTRERAASLKRLPILNDAARAWPLLVAGQIWALLVVYENLETIAEYSLEHPPEYPPE